MGSSEFLGQQGRNSLSGRVSKLDLGFARNRFWSAAILVAVFAVIGSLSVSIGSLTAASAAQCEASGSDLGQAKAAYAASCSAPRIDCDPVGNGWTCSSDVIGDLAPGGRRPAQPVAAPAKQPAAPLATQPVTANNQRIETPSTTIGNTSEPSPQPVPAESDETAIVVKAAAQPQPEPVESRSEPTAGGGAMPCAGSSVAAAIASYSPPSMRRQATQTFTSLSDLQSAINAKSDHGGAVLQLAAGRYTFSKTAIDITNKKNLTVYSDPSNRAVLDGQNSANFGVNVKETSAGGTHNVQVVGFEVERTRYHGLFLGSDADGTRAGSNIYLGGNYIHDAANEAGAGITVRNATSAGLVVVEGNEIARIDLDGTGSGRGEGIYVGQGKDASHYGRNVVIRGNFIHDTPGEAIDIKRSSRNIVIEYNRIKDITVFSQGAITVSIDNLRPQTSPADIVVRRNVITNVRTRGFDGNAIVIGTDSLVEENVISGIEKNPIDIYNDANGPDKVTTIRNNVIQNFGGEAIRENVGTGNRGPSHPFTVDKSNNGSC